MAETFAKILLKKWMQSKFHDGCSVSNGDGNTF